jgi:hypothetical protein
MATNFRFTKAFDYEIRSPKGALQGIKAYAAGTTELVPEAHAEAAEKAGAGERVTEAKATAAKGGGKGAERA